VYPLRVTVRKTAYAPAEERSEGHRAGSLSLSHGCNNFMLERFASVAFWVSSSPSTDCA
jgi:hypothetical protein